MRHRDYFYLVEAMLTRPAMYAQNPGSLEDQFNLVSSFLSHGICNHYVAHVQKTKGPMGADKNLRGMADFLRQFWEQDDEVEFFREWNRRSSGKHWNEKDYTERYCDFRDQYDRLGVFWTRGGPKKS